MQCRVLKITLALAKSRVRHLFLVEGILQLRSMLFGFHTAVAFGLGLCTLGLLDLVERSVYLTDRVPVIQIRKCDSDQRDHGRNDVAVVDHLEDDPGQTRTDDVRHRAWKTMVLPDLPKILVSVQPVE